MNTIYLVGAGPGDPKLLTRRAHELLLSADQVVYDALVSPAILALIPPQVERIHVGKRAGAHSLGQEEINALLVQLGQTGKGRHIIRLKGGDPFVFGRGGEEMLALRQAGIPYEVVPGITAGIAAPAYFDIPITHRGLSQSFTCLTAYTEDEGLSDLDWSSLARLGGTLVFYMGVRQVAKISAALIGAGAREELPAALVSRGTTPYEVLEQRTLSKFARTDEDFSSLAPALFVVGEVLQLSEGRTARPLLGKKILVTRARHQASSLREGLEVLGAEAVLLPTIELSALPVDSDTLVRAVTEHRWIIFSSPNAVEYFFRLLFEAGMDSRSLGHTRLAVLGPMTSRSLEGYGLRADFQPSVYNAEVFAREFLALYGEEAQGEGILLPCSALAQDTLPKALAEAGLSYTRLPLYANRAIEYTEAELQEAFAGAHWLTACSSSAIHHLVELLQAYSQEQLLQGLDIAVLGEQTALAARSHDLEVRLIAPEATIPSLIQTLVEKS